MALEVTNWDPTEEQINEAKKEYLSQCPLLDSRDTAAKQKNLWKMLAIGKINNMPDLLENLAASYTQSRIKQYQQNNEHLVTLDHVFLN